MSDLTTAAALTPTCTIVAEFLGIMLDECGQVATHTSTGSCGRGHTSTRLICVHHAQSFAALPDAVVCAQCAAEGLDTQMALVVTELPPQEEPA